MKVYKTGLSFWNWFLCIYWLL